MVFNNITYEYTIKVNDEEFCYENLKEAKKHAKELVKSKVNFTAYIKNYKGVHPNVTVKYAKVISYKDGLYTFYNAPNFNLFRKFNTYQNSLINICNKYS